MSDKKPSGHDSKFGDIVKANLITPRDLEFGIALRNLYHMECFGPDGKLKWEEKFGNLVVNVGLDDILDKYFKGSSYTAAWYVGIWETAGSPEVAAGDSMASHAGWTEVTSYSEANRPTLTLGTVASQSVDNSASKASYSINASKSVRGAFITTSNAKGGVSPETGILYSVGAFTGGTKAVDNGDTLNVTVTLTSAAA